MNSKYLLIYCVLFSWPLFSRDYVVPLDVKTKYRYLEDEKVKTLPDGSQAFHQARRFLRQGIHVLYLKGDRYEMAYQHGRLMKEEIKKGALPGSAQAVYNAVANDFGQYPVLTPLIAKIYYRTVSHKMFKSSVTNATEEVGLPLNEAYGLSEGSGLPLEDVINGAVGPESLTVMLGQTLSPNQCSSFVAKDSATATGELIIGRNTDYPLNGRYDRFPTVMYFNPTDGTQKYMSVISAGLHTAGVVGLNESGLYIDVHTIPTRDISAEGTVVFMAAQEVLRLSRTFDEAVKLFQESPPAAGWTYVLVSTKERKVATLEMSASHFAVRPMEGDTHIQTNHWLTEKMKPVFAPVNIATDEDTRMRYERIKERLEQLHGTLNPQNAASILGDKFDYQTKTERVLGNTVGVHTTMTSAVVLPERGKIYVANGTAPVSQNEYVEFPMVNIDPETFASSAFETFRNDDFKIRHPDLAQAEQKFIQAKIAFEDALDTPKSIQLLKETIAIDDTSPGYTFILGALYLINKQYDEAGTQFQKLTLGPNKHYQNLGHYYLARIHANRGNPASAYPEIEKITSDDAKLYQAAQDLSITLHRRGRLKFGLLDLPLMFQQADMIEYR